MNIEKMREDFKAWAITNGFEEHHFWLRDDGDYADYDIRLLWHPWQSSRESLVIELPERLNEGWQDGDPMEVHPYGDFMRSDDVIQAIESLGLKVK